MSGPDPAAIPTVVDAGASFEGLITFRGAARIEGQVTGRVVADGCLVIGPRGRVKATIDVDELVVAGELEGDVTARARVGLLATSRVSGTLRAPTFALAEGCRFDGRMDSIGAGGAPEENPPERLGSAAEVPSAS
jgi:cytoskeletal protein CcmA (bactofilin family)